MKFITTLFLLFVCLFASAQPYQNIASDDISFVYEANDAAKQYNISVKFTNNAAQPLLVYQKIEPGYLQNPWGNLYIELEKKVNGSYIPIVAYTSNTAPYASQHPSYTYDFPREVLSPGATKIIQYPNPSTLFRIADLDGNVSMYRFKVHVRVKFESQYPASDRKNVIIYKTSEWFYFLPV
jgi:hypothetical protein